MLSGYAGKIAWIDLTERTTKVQDLDEGAAKKYLGVRGLAPTCSTNISSLKPRPMIRRIF
jgi:aldehyde:ferredoxin oxidoreductase